MPKQPMRDVSPLWPPPPVLPRQLHKGKGTVSHMKEALIYRSPGLFITEDGCWRSQPASQQWATPPLLERSTYLRLVDTPARESCQRLAHLLGGDVSLTQFIT